MSERRICPSCEAEREFRHEERNEEYNVRGEIIRLPVRLEVCVTCNESLCDEARDEALIEQAYAQYRERKGLLGPDEIQGIREGYSLSQKSFAALLGMSEATINRYEGGGLQDEAHDTAIRAQAKTESMIELLRRKGDLLTERQRRKAEAALAERPQERLKRLHRRLSSAGLNRKFIQSVVLPEWWDAEETGPVHAFRTMVGYISRHLGFSEKLLEDAAAAIAPGDAACKLKLRKGASEEDLRWPLHIAAQAAYLACEAIPVDPISFPESASAVRNEILKGGSEYVDLDSLLEFCWSRAVPVLHVSRYPANCKKMDGLAANVEGRPAVVISKNAKYSAWLLFILAHELGHIACDHVASGSVLLDDKVERDSTDAEEQEANAFAVELLTGRPDTVYRPRGNRLTAPALADAARREGEKRRVDPGVVALNYAWGQQFFAVGNAALKCIEPDADAPGLIRKRMLDYLEWDELPEETAQFLLRITQPT